MLMRLTGCSLSRSLSLLNGYPTLCPLSLCPRLLCPLVTLSPVTLSSVTLSPSHFVPRSLCPWSLCPLVILSPGHFVPGHFVPGHFFCPLHLIFGSNLSLLGIFQKGIFQKESCRKYFQQNRNLSEWNLSGKIFQRGICQKESFRRNLSETTL
jgi:hypothetical protein